MVYKSVWRLLLLCAVVLTTFYFLYRVREVLVPFVLGALLAYILYRPVRWLEGHHFPRSIAILIFYLVLGGLVYLVAFWMLPKFWHQIIELAHYLPGYWQAVKDYWHNNGGAATLSIVDLAPVKLHLQAQAMKWMKETASGLVHSFSTLIDIVFSPLLGYYILRDWEKLRDGFLAFWPVKYRQEINSLGNSIDQVLQSFIRGQLLVCVIEGTLVGVVTAFLGVKFAFLIGILAAIAELFPYFGPLLSGIPAVAIALLQSPRLGIYTLIAFIIIQQIEGNIISPRIIGGHVGLNPLLVIFVLLAGGTLFGVWGMLLAVPLAAVIKVLGQYAYYRLV